MRKIFILILLQFLFSCENKITENTKVSMESPQIETRKDSVGLESNNLSKSKRKDKTKQKENNSLQSDKTTGKKIYGVVLYTVYDEGLSENLPKFTEIFLVDSEITNEDEQRIINSKINNQYNEKIVYKIFPFFVCYCFYKE